MPAAGTVRILIDSTSAADAACWLRNWVPPETLLCTAQDCSARRTMLLRLAAQLEKAGRSARGRRFIYVRRDLAECLSNTWHPCTIGLVRLWPRTVLRLRKRLERALNQGKRVGRPALRRDEILRRVNRQHAYADDRNRKRLKRRLSTIDEQARQSALFDQWFDEVTARGETIATTTLPFPKTP